MRTDHESAAKTETIVPLDPIGATRPPHKEGGDIETQLPKTDEPKEALMPEDSEDAREVERDEPKQEVEYKGDRNAPMEAEHPLANPPQVPEGENPRD